MLARFASLSTILSHFHLVTRHGVYIAFDPSLMRRVDTAHCLLSGILVLYIHGMILMQPILRLISHKIKGLRRTVKAPPIRAKSEGL